VAKSAASAVAPLASSGDDEGPDISETPQDTLRTDTESAVAAIVQDSEVRQKLLQGEGIPWFVVMRKIVAMLPESLRQDKNRINRLVANAISNIAGGAQDKAWATERRDGKSEALRERGKVQARAFRLFERNESDGRIARRIGLPIEEIQRLRKEYERPVADRAVREFEASFAQSQRSTDRMMRERRARERDERAYELELQRLKLAERVVALREQELRLAERMAERGEGPWTPERHPVPTTEFRALERVLDALVDRVGRR
jgi:hypothetical protein